MQPHAIGASEECGGEKALLEADATAHCIHAHGERDEKPQSAHGNTEGKQQEREEAKSRIQTRSAFVVANSRDQTSTSERDYAQGPLPRSLSAIAATK